MNHLPSVMLERHRTRPAPVAGGTMIVGERQARPRGFSRREHQRAMHFFQKRQTRQILQLVIGIGERQFTVQVGAIADNQHLLGIPTASV
jgi:hypothetical protein